MWDAYSRRQAMPFVYKQHLKEGKIWRAKIQNGLQADSVRTKEWNFQRFLVKYVKYVKDKRGQLSIIKEYGINVMIFEIQVDRTVHWG